MGDKDEIDYGKPHGVQTCDLHINRDGKIEGTCTDVARILKRLTLLTVASFFQSLLLIGLSVLMYGVLFGTQGMNRTNIVHVSIPATLERIK